MPEYEVYATRWDDPHIVEELLPARELSFSLPLSEHGECSFSATVEPGRSLWRASVTPPLSGVLVTRDDVPVWSGWVTSERPGGPRTFQFTAREWGSFFATTPARVFEYSQWADQAIFRDLVDYAQTQAGQDVHVETGSFAGGSVSDMTINAWDNRDTESAYRMVADQEDGPEWYFGTSGTKAAPVRSLVLGSRLGSVDPVDVLHYVEDTEDWFGADGASSIALLGDLFPAGTIVSGIGRRGGNVVALGRTRDTARSTTVAVAVGDGTDKAQVRSTARATRLIDTVGWPAMTRWFQHSSVMNTSTLARHARADLAASAGIATGYELVTLDGDPDWTQVARGSTMRVTLDTDVFAGPRPHTFDSRVLSMQVNVPDDGGSAQVTWALAETLDPS